MTAKAVGHGASDRCCWKDDTNVGRNSPAFVSRNTVDELSQSFDYPTNHVSQPRSLDLEIQPGEPD